MPNGRYLLPAVMTILTSLVFLPPTVGLANNGDFGKITGWFSLGAPSDDEYGFARLEYRFDPKYHWESGFYSSEMLFAGAAIGLSRFSTGAETFDVRWLGVIHSVTFLAAFWLLAPVLVGLGRSRFLALTAAIALIFGDLMYTSHMNSAYMDTAAFLFLFLSAAFFLRWVRWHRTADTIGFTVCSSLMLLSKAQHALLGIWILLLFALCWKRTWLLAAPVVLAAGIFSWRSPPAEYAPHAYYSVMFQQILPHSANVTGDLEALGLDDSYRPFIGTHAYSAESGMNDPEFVRVFMQRTSFPKLGWFYLTHPRDTYLALIEALNEGGRQRPLLGNFDRSAGNPAFTESYRFALWSSLKQKIFYHHGLRYLLAIVLLPSALCLAAYRRRISRAHLIAVFALAGMGATAMLIASLADAVEVGRHFVLATAILDIQVVSLVALILRPAEG